MSLPRLRKRWGLEGYSPTGTIKLFPRKFWFKFDAENYVIEVNKWAEIVGTRNRVRVVDLREYT